jgi:hypothetical protein
MNCTGISRLRSRPLFHSPDTPLITPARFVPNRSKALCLSLRRNIWCRFTYLANFQTRPIHSHPSHPSKPRITSRYTNPYLPPDQVDDHPLAVWVLPKDLPVQATKSFKNTKTGCVCIAISSGGLPTSLVTTSRSVIPMSTPM